VNRAIVAIVVLIEMKGTMVAARMENIRMADFGTKEEVYLGDGLYASFDGFQITLRAPRWEGDHFVALEPNVFEAFLGYAKSIGWKDLI
jgi:hypothetical protein